MGLSQDSIGKAIGVTFQQIQKYERGINRMGASRIYDFAKALNVPVSYFFEGYGDDLGEPSPVYGMAEIEAPAFEHEQISNRETMDVMRAYHKIKNPQVRKRIVDLIKSMAEESAAK